MQNCAAQTAWKNAGCPTEGPLYEEKGGLHQVVRRRVHFCAAWAERLQIQRREKLLDLGTGFGHPKEVSFGVQS